MVASAGMYSVHYVKSHSNTWWLDGVVLYLFVYVWLTMQELVGRFLVAAAGHAAFLEIQRVQLTDRPRPQREVFHQLGLVGRHLFSGEPLWMKVHYGHGVALCVGPCRDLSPVTPSVEQQAGLQRREAEKVLITPGHQFVLLRHVEQVVSVDADDVSLPARAHVKPNRLWISIRSSVN